MLKGVGKLMVFISSTLGQLEQCDVSLFLFDKGSGLGGEQFLSKH
jgi:hypothetical protein